MRYFLLINLLLFFVFSNAQQQMYQSGFSNQEREEILQNISKLEPMFQRDPTPEMAVQLADAFLFIKKYKKAISYYEYALEQKPLSEKATSNYFNALFEFGDLNLANTVAKEYYVRFGKIHLKAKMDSFEKLSKENVAQIENYLSANTKNNEYGLYPLFADYRIINSDASVKENVSSKYMNPYIVSLNNLNSEISRLYSLLENENYLYAITHFDPVERKAYITQNTSIRFNVNKIINSSSTMKMFTAVLDAHFRLGPLEPFKYNSDIYSVGHASISKDGQTLYFVSDMQGGYGGTDLYRCMKLEDGSWGNPINLGKNINTEGDEMFPFISPKGNVLYFSSTGNSIFGGLDINKSFKSRANVFSKPVNLGAPINSNKDDFGIVFTDDNGQEGFFSSSRVEGLGGVDIYKFKYDQKNDLSHKSTDSKKLTTIKAYDETTANETDDFIEFKSTKPSSTSGAIPTKQTIEDDDSNVSFPK